MKRCAECDSILGKLSEWRREEDTVWLCRECLEVEQAVDLLLAENSRHYVYRKDGRNEGRHFSDIREILNCAQSSPGPKTVEIASDVELPPGVFDMRDVTLVGPEKKTVTASIPDGVIFDNLSKLGGGLTLHNKGSSPPIRLGKNQTFTAVMRPEDQVGANMLSGPPSAKVVYTAQCIHVYTTWQDTDGELIETCKQCGATVNAET